MVGGTLYTPPCTCCVSKSNPYKSTTKPIDSPIPTSSIYSIGLLFTKWLKSTQKAPSFLLACFVNAKLWLEEVSSRLLCYDKSHIIDTLMRSSSLDSCLAVIHISKS